MAQSKSTQPKKLSDVEVGTEPVALEDGTIVRPFTIATTGETVMARDAAHALEVAGVNQTTEKSSEGGDD